MSHLFEDKSNNFLLHYKTNQSDETSQIINSQSWSDLTGSEISYVPALNSNYIIYEYWFLRTKYSERAMNVRCKLVYSDDDGSSWSDYLNHTNTLFGSGNNYTQYRSLTNIRLCLDSWGTSSKKLKIQGSVHNASTDAILLHKLNTFYDESGVTGDRYIKPFVSCYSVRSS
jgi:hypothetical protein